MDKALRIRIDGRVQGVGFRYWAFKQASILGLGGWVRNEADGSVLIECEGSSEDVDNFVSRLRRGPPGARIDRVETREIEAGVPRRDFTIKFQ